MNKNFDENTIREIIEGIYTGDRIEFAGTVHFRYSDCNIDDLVNVNSGMRLHKACFDAFKNMQKHAKIDGLKIQIVSAFRSTKYQKGLFAKNFKDKKNPTLIELEKRIKWSAPSGFSEHHTGLAIDINDTEIEFAQTSEYAWLQTNAHKFGFEMSFPKNNRQNVGFEPWHWRYVGEKNFYDMFKSARIFNNEAIQ